MRVVARAVKGMWRSRNAWSPWYASWRWRFAGRKIVSWHLNGKSLVCTREWQSFIYRHFQFAVTTNHQTVYEISIHKAIWLSGKAIQSTTGIESYTVRTNWQSARGERELRLCQHRKPRTPLNKCDVRVAHRNTQGAMSFLLFVCPPILLIGIGGLNASAMYSCIFVVPVCYLLTEFVIFKVQCRSR